MRRLLVAVAVLVLAAAALAVVMAVRAVRYTSRQVVATPAAPFAAVPGAPQRLAAAIAIPTISYDDPTRRDTAAFARLREHLASSFPRVHAGMRREVLDQGAVLYTWRGADSVAAPLVLLAHVDVVPVEPGTESRWTHPPFAGVVDAQYIWGRGTQDDKGAALGILEAAEALLSTQFQPRRTVYIALGADEESGGRGAHAVAESLRVRGVRPALVLD